MGDGRSGGVEGLLMRLGREWVNGGESG